MNTPARRYSTATWVSASRFGPRQLTTPAPLAPQAYPEPEHQVQDAYTPHDGPIAYGDMSPPTRHEDEDDIDDEDDTDIEEGMEIDPNHPEVIAEMNRAGSLTPEMPIPTIPRVAPAPPGSDFHADSPAEFARRPNDLLHPVTTPTSRRKSGRLAAFKRALTRFLKIFSLSGLVQKVKMQRAIRRQRPISVPDFEFRDPTPAPPSIRLTYSRDLEDGRHTEVQQNLVSRRASRAEGGRDGQNPPVTMIEVGTIRGDENELRRTVIEQNREDALRTLDPMSGAMPMPMPMTVPMDRQASGHSHHSATGHISRERSRKSSRTQGGTGETTAVHHDAGIADYDQDRRYRSPRTQSPSYPAQPPNSIQKSHSLSMHSTHSYSQTESQSTITHSSNLVVHLKAAYHSVLALYHLPWVATPPHRVAIDFVPAYSSARSKYRARRRHGTSGVPAADYAAKRAIDDMAEGESWYRLSAEQMAKRRERREMRRALRRSYAGTHSKRSSDYYHRLAETAAPGSPRRPPAAYASPTQAAAVPPTSFGGGPQYVAIPNGMGGQQFYVLSPAPGAAPPLPMQGPHGSPGESANTARSNVGGGATPSRRMSIMSTRRRPQQQQQQSSLSLNSMPGAADTMRGSPPQPMYFVPTFQPPPGTSPGPGSPSLPQNYLHAMPYPFAQQAWAPGPAQSHPQAQAH